MRRLPSPAMRWLMIATFALLAVAVWPAATTATAPGHVAAQCVGPAGVQRVVFSAAEYPNIRRHFRRAVLRRGWPRRLVLNRRGADAGASDCCATFRRARASIATSTRRRSAADVVRAWSAVASRAAGRRTCGTCPARRTACTARRSARSSSRSATARDSATCFASRAPPLSRARPSGPRSPAAPASRSTPDARAPTPSPGLGVHAKCRRRGFGMATSLLWRHAATLEAHADQHAVGQADEHRFVNRHAGDQADRDYG